MEKYFQYQSAKIFYRVEGKGKPVVLLHGLPVNGTVWNDQINFLKDDCQLIVPDLPGSGQSKVEGWRLTVDSKTSTSFSSTINDQRSTIKYFTDCIFALLQYENISECIMIGHSMGGYITLDFAEKYPYVLKAFGLIHSTAFADSKERKENRRRAIELTEQYGAYSFLKNMIPNLFSSSFKKNHPEKIELLIEQTKQFPNEVFLQYYTAMMNRPDRTTALKNAALPVLFVMGTEDTAAPLNDLLQQVHLCEIAYIHILENVAHMSMWEATEKLNEAILNFVRAE